MDEMFKKLAEYEASGTYNASEWDKFEATLPKKRKKRFFWLWFSSLFSILSVAICVVLVNNKAVDGNELSTVNQKKYFPKLIVHENIEEEKLSEDRIKKIKPKEESKISRPVLQGNKPSKRITNTKIKSNQIQPQQAVNLKHGRPAVQPGKLNLLNKPIVNRPPSIYEVTQPNQVASISEFDNILPLIHFGLVFIPVDQNIQNPNVLAYKIEPLPILSNSFSVYGGFRLSAINRLNNNSDVSTYSYGAGLFAQANYIRNQFLGFTAQCGFQLEYGHSVKYSYISDRVVFLEKSEKSVNIDVKQLTSANIQLSTLLNWTSKHVTSLGGFYNVVLQSRSNVSVIGTGQYTNFSDENLRQKSYHTLLNSGDYGAYFSQSYRVNPSWSLSLEFFLGTSNRLNESYFSNKNIKRREFSLSILKKI